MSEIIYESDDIIVTEDDINEMYEEDDINIVMPKIEIPKGK